MTTQIILTHARPYTPDKCNLCEAKLPPHPAHLRLTRRTGSIDSYDLCPKCDALVTKLSELVGTESTTILVEQDRSGTAQLTMELEGEDEQHDDEPEPITVIGVRDVIGPVEPTEDVPPVELRRRRSSKAG